MTANSTPARPHNWGTFGPDDELGTLNYLTAEAVLRGTRSVVTGERYTLNLPLDTPRSAASGEPLFKPGGAAYAKRSFRRIAGRGVLLDIARMISGGSADPLPADFRCTPELTKCCIQHEGVEIMPGDIVCFRTGWIESYLAAEQDEQDRMGLLPDGSFRPSPGITSDHAPLADTARWAAVAADNPGIEAMPLSHPLQSAHVRMLRNLGMPFGELLHLASLAEAAAADRRWDFLFVAVPLWIPGGAGSPANAMAIR